ncbi:MAG: ABC transporter permease [Phycisphaeraceae bacterium]|nr:ABC transporter permease [Phycisphaerales bacterium]MCB9860759.1 ABC transporter permease [Phycisphaeraceae bacterium]
MWSYIIRRLLYNIPVYLGILLLVMLALRVNDPVTAYQGKNATAEQKEQLRKDMGLDRPFLVQYGTFVSRVVTLNFKDRSWEEKRPIGQMIRAAVPPTIMITVPQLFLTASISIVIGLVCSFYRGRLPDKSLMFAAVLGMSISYLVYIMMGQYYGAYVLGGKGITPFEVEGYEPIFSFEPNAPEKASFFMPGNWMKYCALPVLIGVIVGMGYDTRFYRAVMVEECTRDYITTARAKGATNRKIMFVHMLKNAMIPIITRIMISLPFLIAGSILAEYYFNIPGMGRLLINSINSKDFPVVQYVTALFAAVVIFTVILTDVLYAVVDPRVRLS